MDVSRNMGQIRSKEKMLNSKSSEQVNLTQLESNIKERETKRSVRKLREFLSSLWPARQRKQKRREN